MNIEKQDIITAFEKSIRNRYYKLFDYYEAWFLNKKYLSIDLAHKISVDLGITIKPSSVKYIRSKILKNTLLDRANDLDKFIVLDKSKSQLPYGKTGVNHLDNSMANFEFKEPKSIDYNQEIVTIRKSRDETS